MKTPSPFILRPLLAAALLVGSFGCATVSATGAPQSSKAAVAGNNYTTLSQEPVEVSVVSTNITKEDILRVQQEWGSALVQIAKDYDQFGYAKAKATAEAALDESYGYNIGPVLFKPTLTTAPQTFRTDREGALSYFVGGNPKYPSDTGFGLKGWRSYEIRNVAIQLHGNFAVVMGKVGLVDKTGKVTEVDKTWGYVKDEKGKLRIVLHHSSLPVTK